MDSDWCTFCGKHVETSGLLYCGEICRQKDRIAGSTLAIKANTAKPIINTLSATATFSNSSLKSKLQATFTNGKLNVSDSKSTINEIPFTLKLHKKNNAILPIMPKGYPTIMKSAIRPQRYSIIAY
ncbi:hypothetical protein K7432_002464 [Basidiobolus ranarum]|uniref:Uncharacterized protein n=1 Tax=Basidiobolus ranarum TaxID=34480 RepID=A0ABR2W7R4_9FUNG